MLRTVFQSDNPPFVWRDLVEPTPADLAEIAEHYDLAATAVQDCLDPEHLPKFERYEGRSVSSRSPSSWGSTG
jgi:magnesium transporter